jgi:hypothetical protein
MKHERRSFPRVPSAYLAYLTVTVDGENADGIPGKTLDLSITGVALELSRPPAEHAAYTVALSLHDEIHTFTVTLQRCARLAEDLWEAGFRLEVYSKRYFQLLSRSFADAA